MTVLVVDDDASVAEFCRQVLSQAGHAVLVVASGDEALAALDEHEIDVVLSDVIMPGMDGLDLLRSIAPGNGGPAVVLMTGFGSISAAVKAIRLGAYDYLVKPFVADELEATLQRLTELRAVRAENLVLRYQLDSERGTGGMGGGSPGMLAVLGALPRIAGKRQPVLITGETGTGKELVARAINDRGPDKDRPFVVVDCGALSPEIVESEIFGHVSGAFTGAIGDRPGLLAMANAGPNTGDCQFFITVAPTPHLNGHHTIFGEAIEGLDVVQYIAKTPRDAQDRPLTPVRITGLTFKREGPAPPNDPLKQPAPASK